MPGFPGGVELIIILVIVLLLFGSKKLPELARGLGKSITNFKSGLNEEQQSETETTAQQEKETPQKEEVS
ncbi:MAG: twin-arginine translocase TatA/TatE family subunit [Candidatus Poribacteria bacterium]|nr:twin-arginine translocase TatA/TatE family subunit [Candidatus Poribacteria bacterium]